MAVTITNKYAADVNSTTVSAQHGPATVNCGTVTTGAILIVSQVGTTNAGGAGNWVAPTKSSGTATIGTAVQIGEARDGAANAEALTIVWRIPVTSGGTLVLSTDDLTARDNYGWACIVDEVTGHDTGTPIVGLVTNDGANVSTPASSTLTATPALGDVAYAVVDWDTDTNASNATAAGSGWTKTQGINDTYTVACVQTRTGSTSTAVDWPDVTFGTVYSFGAVAFIIKAATGGGGQSTVGAGSFALAASGTVVKTGGGGGGSGDIALVQSAVNGTANTACNVTYPSALTPGSHLIVTVNWFDDPSLGTFALSDSAGHTWTPIIAAEQVDVLFQCWTRSWIAPNSGSTTPTVTASLDSTAYFAVVISEWTGVDPTTPLDGVTPVINNTQAPGTVPFTATTTNITPATNNAVIYGALVGNWTGVGDPTFAVTNGTLIQERESWTADMAIAVAYKEQTTAAAEAITWSVGNENGTPYYSAHAFVLRAAPAGGPSAVGTSQLVLAASGTVVKTSAPGTITNLAATPGNGQVTLTWTAPAANGAAITDYVVEYRIAPTNLPFAASVDATNKRILDQYGQPWFGVGDTPWSLVAQIAPASITSYLNDIAALGINFILVNIPEPNFTDNSPKTDNQQGDAPFTGALFNSSLNEPYWAVVDDMLLEAKALGITVLICPQYIGYNDTEGFGYELTDVYNTNPTALTTYGQALAARYPVSTYPNIIWLIGHDRISMTTAHKAASKLIADELPTGHLLCFGGHHSVANGSADGAWAGSGIASDFDTLYTYGEDTGSKTATLRATRTVMFIEGKYEQEQSVGVGAQVLREQSWEAFGAGTCGVLFGNNPRWHFESGKELYAFGGTWQQSLTDAAYNDGTIHTGHLASFISGNPGVLDTLPDTTNTFQTAGAGFARFNTTMGLVYQSGTGSLTLDTTELAGTGNVKIRRFDPTTGGYTTVAASEAQNAARSITYPGANAAGGTDWVYIVELV